MKHYCDVTMSAIASQITSLTIVYSTVYSDANQSKHLGSASLAFVWGSHSGPVNSPHKWPVTRKMFPFDENFPFVLKCKHDHFMLFGYWATWVKEVFQTLASSYKRSGRPRHANNTSVTCTSMCNLHVLYLLRSETTIRWQYNVTGVNSKYRESWWELFSHFKWRHLVHEMTK